MNRYLLQIKRELWEHKGTLITTPLVVLVVFIVLTFFMGMAGRDVMQDGQFMSQHNGMMSFYSFSSGGQQSFEYHKDIAGYTNDAMIPSQEMGVSPELHSGMQLLSALPYIAFDHLAWLICFIYLLSCLFMDRKDKSILFWKSMPVSEWQNVLTKLFVAALIIPAISWLAASAYNVFSLLSMLLWSLLGGAHNNINVLLQHQNILGAAWSFLGSYIATAIWMLPFVGLVLLVSAFAKKTPFLYFVFPILALLLIEYTVLGSHHISQVIGSYIDVSNPKTGQNMLNTSGWHHVLDVLSSVQCWIGVVSTAGFLYATVWLRENRFES